MPPKDLTVIRRALLSVSNKTGLLELAKSLQAANVEIISTGGTAKELRSAGIEVTDVAQLTGFPEIMGGRVKTLHPKIHGGLLARRNLEKDVADMDQQNIRTIDLLVVNLYPFESTLENTNDSEIIIENIDIGGPAMLRAAAKNYKFLTVLSDPADYKEFSATLQNSGGTRLKFRKRLAAKAFLLTTAYDSVVSRGLTEGSEKSFPDLAFFVGYKALTLRYGENPHQMAALYETKGNRPSITTANKVQGKPLSYNNLNDADAAFELVSEFDEPTIAIIKHANPCGVATHKDLASAWEAAFAADPLSAFGGIVAMNRKLDETTAQAISEIFTEVIIAPDANSKAIKILKEKPNLRLLLTGDMPEKIDNFLKFKSVTNGILVQTHNDSSVSRAELRVVTKKTPTDEQLDDLLFAWIVAKHVKSNAIVFAKNKCSVGIGAGQMSRVDAASLATQKSKDIALHYELELPQTHGSVAASDAFFPFADGLQILIDAGALAVIQPGGSVRDDEVIAAADAAGVAMVFTDIRNFNH